MAGDLVFGAEVFNGHTGGNNTVQVRILVALPRKQIIYHPGLYSELEDFGLRNDTWAEHNDGQLASLRELSLEGQSIERIELIAQRCPRLEILHLQNNIIARIEGLHRLKDLQELNLAINNLTRVDNLHRCESLHSLDLTLNFIASSALPSLASLADNCHLRQLTLLGNPCCGWHGYRNYVVSLLPQLAKLDGQPILPSERIAAAQQLHCLIKELEDEGAQDPPAEVAEEGQVQQGACEDARRPWCPETRVLENRELERLRRGTSQTQGGELVDSGAGCCALAHPVRTALPPLVSDQPIPQRNEGRWPFTLEDSGDGASLVLEVALGRFLDTSLIQADVQPGSVRLLIKGRLLQLALPDDVSPDASTARRSQATGRLVVTMPKAQAARPRPARLRAAAQKKGCAAQLPQAALYTPRPGGGTQRAAQHGRLELGDALDAVPPL